MRIPFTLNTWDSTGPAHGHVNITPADADLDTRLREIFVGTGGTVRVSGPDGVVATYTVTDGAILPGYFDRVWATGTTASNIVGRI